MTPSLRMRFWTFSASSTCFLASVSRTKASRSFSSSASLGQPNRAGRRSPRPSGVDRIEQQVGRSRGQDEFQPPSERRPLLGPARDQGLPVHRLHVDLEAALLEQCLGDRREIGQHGDVGRVQQDDRRAVVARFLEQLLRLLEVRLARGRPCRRSRAACRRRTSRRRSCSSAGSPITAFRKSSWLSAYQRRLADSRSLNGGCSQFKRNTYWSPSGL